MKGWAYSVYKSVEIFTQQSVTMPTSCSAKVRNYHVFAHLSVFDLVIQKWEFAENSFLSIER